MRLLHYTISIFIVFFALFLSVNSADICDSCVCRYEMEEEDFHGETIYCKDNPSVLEAGYSLPTIVYKVDLSRNNLTVVQASAVFKSKSLQELVLSHNSITEISTDAFQLPDLRSLDLSNNELKHIDQDVFQYLRKLDSLNLANNKFVSFNVLNFHYLSNLRELILDNNDIGKSLQETSLFDRTSYAATNKMRSLSLSGVNLDAVPDNFFVEAYDLRKLIISNNSLTEIFQIPFTLDYLDLSDNPIDELLMEDLELPSLKVLKLNNLDITEVPCYTFANLRGLVTLELERNTKLKSFSPLAFGPEVLEDPDEFILEELSLKGSRLTTLDKQLSEPFGQLIRLDLQYNPWKCDCKLQWLRELQIDEEDREQLKCSSPGYLAKQRIFDASESFPCPLSNHHVGLIIAGVAFCVTLTSIAVWMFMFVPRFQSRCNGIRNLYAPSTAYVVLPVNPSGQHPF